MATNVLYRSTADLVRATPSERIIHGCVLPYGETVTVDDGEGPYRERFEFGAFRRSIAERAHKVRLLVQHDRRGRLPIGKAQRLEERSDGLYGEFRVANTRDGDDALTLAAEGLVDFSAGFRGISQRRESDGTLVRTEAALSEASLVGMPAYSRAVVAGVRDNERTLSAEAATARLTLLTLEIPR